MQLEMTDDLDALILEEKQRVAQELFCEAWSATLQEGIEPAIAAQSAVTAVLTQLREVAGDAAIEHLIAALPDQADAGHFHKDRVLQ